MDEPRFGETTEAKDNDNTKASSNINGKNINGNNANNSNTTVLLHKSNLSSCAENIHIKMYHYLLIIAISQSIQMINNVPSPVPLKECIVLSLFNIHYSIEQCM